MNADVWLPIRACPRSSASRDRNREQYRQQVNVHVSLAWTRMRADRVVVPRSSVLVGVPFPKGEYFRQPNRPVT